MNLTVQPNFYTKYLGTKKNQSKQKAATYASRVSFQGDKFDYEKELQIELDKRGTIARLFGLGRGAAEKRTGQKLTGFNMAQSEILKLKDENIEAQKRALDAKQQEIESLRERTATQENLLTEFKARGEQDAATIREIRKSIANLQTQQTQKQAEFDVKSESIRKAQEAEERMTEIKAGKGWDRVAGHEDLKTQLKEAFVDKLALEQGGTKVTMPNGILFYGPQSTGKTLFAKAFAEQSECNFVEINMGQSDDDIIADLKQAGVDSKKLYEKDGKRTIILLDEFDSIAQLAAGEEGHVVDEYRAVPKLKNFLQKCADEYKCTVFMTTNYPRRIDSELLAPHRIPYQVFLGPPGAQDAADAFKFYLRGVDQVMDYNKLAEEVMKARETNHAFSTGQIEMIVRQCREAIVKTGQKLAEADILAKIKELGPDITPQTLARFIDDAVDLAGKIR